MGAGGPGERAWLVGTRGGGEVRDVSDVAAHNVEGTIPVRELESTRMLTIFDS